MSPSVIERLWLLCFDDDDKTVKEFYSIPEVYTVKEYENGELCAMANLLPVCAGELCGFYAYAVCVHPDHRQKGYFRRVMNGCEKYAKESGAQFLCLIPASDELDRSYRRMGYTHTVINTPEDGGEGVAVKLLSEGFLSFCEDGYGAVHAQSGLAKSLCGCELPKMFFSSPMGDA